MLQDIAPHIYRNQMSWKAPDADDFVLCYRGRTLYCKVEDRNLILPRVKDVAADALQYAFSIDERADYLLSDAEFEEKDGFSYLDTGKLRSLALGPALMAAAAGESLYRWYSSQRFCGRCGRPMEKSKIERAMVCPACSNTVYPKICPAVISMIVVPFCSLVLSVIIAHTVLGPIGWKIGTFISDIVYAGISGSFRVVFGAIFGFVYAPLVITGLHHMSNAIDMQLIADFGGTMLWPMIALSNIAQGSAVLGIIYLQRKNAAAQEVNVPSCISCYLGVTEPAMFGVNLKFHFPFICGMIGSAIAAVVCVATSTTANAIGVGGIPGILSIQPAYMLSFALCMAIAIVVPFVLTVIVGKKKGVA